MALSYMYEYAKMHVDYVSGEDGHHSLNLTLLSKGNSFFLGVCTQTLTLTSMDH